MAIASEGMDPTWGPFAQCTGAIDGLKNFRDLKNAGAKVICWIEGFGDTFTYVAAFDRNSDGSFLMRKDQASMAWVKRDEWNWTHWQNPPGNTCRWVGIHNVVNNEDFTMPAFSREKVGLKLPTYPDGRSAVGWLTSSEWDYPLNAAVYDACAAKDINGHIHPALEVIKDANTLDPATGKPKGPTEGLFLATVGNNGFKYPGAKNGDKLYCGGMSIHKDLSAPFWQDYAHLSARELVKEGLDGVWCDNYSPWDNFNYQAVQGAFGDWSVYRFHEYLRDNFSSDRLRALGITDPAAFDVRDYLKKKAAQFGSKDPSNLDDPVWSDARWLDEPVWSLFKAFRQTAAQADLRGFYHAIHDEADAAGRPDFCIQGNDIPLFSLGWVREDYLDMVDTELNAGWNHGTGTRGITLPPAGKMAVVYQAAHLMQKGPLCSAWYYMDNKEAKYQGKSVISKLLESEAFANGALLLCSPHEKKVCGTAESHAWLNTWVRQNEQALGVREPVAEVGVLFSPDNQLWFMTPNGNADMNKQAHTFGYFGWGTAMVDGHIPFQALADWKIDSLHLARFTTFIIPDARCMNDSSLPVLEKWVKAGGHLIVTGPSGTRYSTSGYFRKRANPLFAGLIDESGAANKQVNLGKGKITWMPAGVGMDYYNNIAQRDSLRANLLSVIGASGIIDGATLPATVSVSPWRSGDGKAIFADLVNYNIDLDADKMTPAENLTFRVHLPRGWKSAKAITLSPDEEGSAQISVSRGWATIKVAKLTNLAVVKLVKSAR